MKERSLIIQCSNSCPCFCPGCYNFFSDKQITSKEMVDFIVMYKDLYNLRKVTLSGGDPLLRDDISIIINFLLERDLAITIDTVGTAFLHPMERKLLTLFEKIDYLGLPLDGTCDQTIHFFRQNISFQQCLMMIEKVKQTGVSICINTVAHAKNLHEITTIGSIVNDDPAIKKWQVFQFMPIGPGGYDTRSFYSIFDEEFDKAIESVKKLRLRNSLQVEYKSIKDRENRYLILGCDGVLWIPQIGPNRTIIGDIHDDCIFDKINKVVFANEKV